MHFAYCIYKIKLHFQLSLRANHINNKMHLWPILQIMKCKFYYIFDWKFKCHFILSLSLSLYIYIYMQYAKCM